MYTDRYVHYGFEPKEAGLVLFHCWLLHQGLRLKGNWRLMAYFCSTAVGTYTGDLGPGEPASDGLSGSDTCLAAMLGNSSAGLETYGSIHNAQPGEPQCSVVLPDHILRLSP